MQQPPPQAPVAGRPNVAVPVDPLVLLKFLKQDFLLMNVICEKAEMFEERFGGGVFLTRKGLDSRVTESELWRAFEQPVVICG